MILMTYDLYYYMRMYFQILFLCVIINNTIVNIIDVNI